MRYLRKQILYDDLRLQIHKNVYEPAEDTFLAADNLSVKKNDTVLDVGTGCGILAILAAKKAKKIVAVDTNPHAVHCAKRNAIINKMAEKIDIREGDLFQPVKAERFSLIVFNAPYLPSTPAEGKSWLDKAWVGGPTGRQLIERFIAEAPRHLSKKGRILLVQSSLANIDETLEEFREVGLDARVIAQKKVYFETIVLIQASHLSGNQRKEVSR
jgi:release factor glutamine methyltransferase